MNKRVHEIAKERGLQTKEVLALLNAAGVQAKSASSSVDEATAQRVLGNGDTPSAAPAAQQDGAEQAEATAPEPQPTDGDQVEAATPEAQESSS